MKRKPQCLTLALLILTMILPTLATGNPTAGPRSGRLQQQPRQAAPVVINEILYRPGIAAAPVPDYDHAWIELLNVSTDPVQVGGWTLSNRDGLTLTVLPDWEIPAGCYLTIHFGAGFDDPDMSDCDGHFWTEPAQVQVFLPLSTKGMSSTLAVPSSVQSEPTTSPLPTWQTQAFAGGENECALYSGPPSTATIVDFVAWSGDGSYDPGTAHDLAVAGGIWTAGDYFESSAVGTVDTIGRALNGYETDSSTDWWIMPWMDFVRPGISQPENPIQYWPENYIVLTDTLPIFTWADIPWVDSYHLQVDDDLEFDSPILDALDIPSNTYTVTTPLTTNLYFYRIAGVVGGQQTRWSSTWLFAIDAGGISTQQVVPPTCPFLWQHKDTELLCTYAPTRTADHSAFAEYLRPGCEETGNAAWDSPHAQTPSLPHNDWYCCRASIAMVNHHYGGDLSQDRISYQTFYDYIDGPEGDLGHGQGYYVPEVTETYSWALNGADIQVKWEPFNFQQLKSWIDSRSCFVAAIPGHCLVPAGYAELQFGSIDLEVLIIQDPWRGANTLKIYSWQALGIPQPQGLQEDLFVAWLQPTEGVTARDQEAAVTTDSDGDGVMDFDETNRFFTDPNHPDSDRDEVPDKEDIRSYTFYDSDCGWGNDALTFPDIDSDDLRAELDCDSDNGGDFDGGEDIDGDGVDCEAGETDPYDPDDDVIGIQTNKTVYAIGEDVYLTGARFHANSSYPYEVAAGCPDLVISDTIGMTGMVSSDGTGTIPQWTPIWTCPAPGEYYVVVDVLKDGHYAEPDNWDPYTCFECQEISEPVIPPPDKVDAPDPISAGERLTYTITIDNVGGTAATNVTLIESYPDQAAFFAADPPPDLGNNVWLLGDLPPDSPIQVTIWMDVLSVPSGTVLINTVTVTSTETVPVSTTEDTLVVGGELPILDLSKTDAPDPVPPASLLTYTISISNVGEGTATAVTLTESYPDKVVFVKAAPPPSQGDNIWYLPDLAAGESSSVLIQVRVFSDVLSGTVLLNSAIVDSAETDPLDVSEETLVAGEPVLPVLELSKRDDPDPVAPGLPLTYTIIISNTGDAEATDVTLVESYPGEITFVAAEPPPSQGNNTWDLGTLPPATSVYIIIWTDVSASILPGSVLTNTVTADCAETDPITVEEITMVVGRSAVQALASPRKAALEFGILKRALYHLLAR